MGVVSIPKDAPAPVKVPIDGTGHADRKALQAAHERGVSVSFHNEMKMIALHTEMEETKAPARSPAKRAADRQKGTDLAQRGDGPIRTKRHMHGTVRQMNGAPLVRNSASAGCGLSAGAPTPSAPRPEDEVELSWPRCHLDSAPMYIKLASMSSTPRDQPLARSTL
jgi:hypothetical protein